MEKKRKSVFIYTGDHADSGPIRVTERDRHIAELLNPEQHYQRLPGPWLARLAGRGFHPTFYSRLTRLSRQPHFFFDRYREDWTHSVFARGQGADRVLNYIPARSKDHFAHRMLEDLVQASIDIGINDDPHFRIHKWHELSHPENILKIIDKDENPFWLPLTQGYCVPDGKPFRLSTPDHHLYILGKEIDRKTENLGHMSTSKERRTIKQKFQHYKEVFDRKIWKSHHGFDNSIVLFVTVDEARMHAMMRLGEQELGPCKWLLFTYWKDWANEKRYPEPTGTMFSRAWKRIGHPDYHLNRFWEMS